MNLLGGIGKAKGPESGDSGPFWGVWRCQAYLAFNTTNRAYGSYSASQSNSDIDVDALREIEIGTGEGGKRRTAKNGEHGNPCQVDGNGREEVDRPGLVVTDQTNRICPSFLSFRFSYHDLI